MPSDFTLRLVNAVHRFVLRATGGRIGARAAGMTVIELTTVGRRSGQPRSVILTSPLQHDGMLVVVASKGGSPKHPDWYLNLLRNPLVEVAFGNEPRQPWRARVASPELRRSLWPSVVERYPGYLAYQRRTDREIPLVLLTPRAEPGGGE